jgi:hypothetical protein
MLNPFACILLKNQTNKQGEASKILPSVRMTYSSLLVQQRQIIFF